MAPPFPSLKSGKLLAMLARPPLGYVVVRQRGSHRVLDSKAGYPRIGFSFHDGVTIPPHVVRRVLVVDVGLQREEALRLCQGG